MKIWFHAFNKVRIYLESRIENESTHKTELETIMELVRIVHKKNKE